MGGIHARKKQAGGQPRAEGVMRAQHAEGRWHEEGDKPEGEPLLKVFPEVVHVDLHRRQKHEVEYSHLPEDLEGGIALEKVEAVWAYGHSGQDQSHHVGYPQAPEHYGSREDKQKHQ